MFGKLWDALQGYKLYAGGIAFILTGLGEIIMSYSADKGFANEGWTKIMTGWGIIAAKSAMTKKNTQPLTEPTK